MNERTKELAEQTGIILNESQKIMLKKFDELTMLKKFDELILRECMAVCADNACRAGGLNTRMGEHLYLATDLIKQHFGVEE